jgi:hypothetical protein
MRERDFNGDFMPSSARRQKKVILDESAFEKPSRRKRKEQVRYWNEYDYPSDGDDANAYYIYIDPDKEDKWFGKEIAVKLYARFQSLFTRSDKIVPDEERALIRPLTEDEDEGVSSSPTNSDTDTPVKTTFFSRKRAKLGYGSISQGSRSHTPQRTNSRLSDLLLPPVETALSPTTSSRLLISALSLSASSILSILIFTLAATGRKKQKGEVDAGILLGVVASLFFALVGLTSVLTARESVGLVNWVIIGGVFCMVCLADGLLIGWVLV